MVQNDDFLISKEFGRETEAGNNVEGGLVYSDDQMNRIMNLNESEVLINGTLKLSGGCLVTKLSSKDWKLSQGTNSYNKSGYSAIFIGGSMVLGWPLPVHIQAKSNTQAGNQKSNPEFQEY